MKDPKEERKKKREQMKKANQAAEQLEGILRELGGYEYKQLVEHMNQLFLLDNPPPGYKENILKEYKGSWEEFVLIWRAYHIHSIAKGTWRKLKAIAKRYPNFDTIIKSMAREGEEE